MEFKLSVSNIGWEAREDEHVYHIMKQYGYSGLEIAPTRIFRETPYEKKTGARVWIEKLKKDYGFIVSSMQSIWFGHQEMLFGSNEERRFLTDYTKKAIDFARTVACKNLVFGCPQNRNMLRDTDFEIGTQFLGEIAAYAAEQGTVIGMEAIPLVYHTNYINDTVSALMLVERVNSEGFRLNLDVGTMLQNEENVSELVGKVNLVNHVHISEPGLRPIEDREIHRELKRVLEDEEYQGFVSIEMGKVRDIKILEEKMYYVRSIFK